MKYVFPSSNLLMLNRNQNISGNVSDESIEPKIRDCLRAHKIDVELQGIHYSPTNIVIDYELKGSSLLRDVQNRQLDLSVCAGFEVKIFQRFEDPGVFSISIPQRNRDIVTLGSVISSDEFQSSESKLTFAAGIDELAKVRCFDLAQAPHLLVSGSTGSGKTVFLDDIILSVLFKATPDEVKMVLIDTSAKDFAVYDKIPHLMCPVITDKVNADITMRTLRNLMNKRFEDFASIGVKEIDSYNLRSETKLPRILIIIDKYIEVSYDIPESFEFSIGEIARKGRAAGIHLIINTQTAKSEIISNDIKTNFLYRAAFSVVDWHESKAVLDKTGAQKLLGNGDMLFRLINSDETIHLQAAYVSEKEIHDVVRQVKVNNELPDYARPQTYKQVVDGMPRPTIVLEDVKKELSPELLYEKSILDAVSGTKYISVLSIQKMLDISFAEATRVMKYLEKNMLVSKNVFLKGRPVIQDNIDIRLKNIEETISM